jgi:hypothetical protein
MNTPRDPIDDWLSSDVELMPPPPGAFERVHRRARTRRTVRAVSTVAGAALVIAAAATLPQVASSLLRGPTGGPAQVGVSTAGPARHGSTPPSPQAHPSRPQPSASQSVPATAAPSLAVGGGVPAAGFSPTSVTFVGSLTGAVIGRTTAHCPAGTCTAVAGTHDYGASWFSVGAPPAGQADGASGASQIRFLDSSNGWAYGPELYATHDGGATWTKINGLAGRVVDLAAAGSRAFAVVSSCAGPGSGYAANCTSFALYSAAASSNRWLPVPGAAGSGQEAPAGLQLTGAFGYLLTRGKLFAGPLSGGAWPQVATPRAPTCLTASGQPGPLLLAPGSGAALNLACDGADAAGTERLTLYVSADGGRTSPPRQERSCWRPAAGSTTRRPGGPGTRPR